MWFKVENDPCPSYTHTHTQSFIFSGGAPLHHYLTIIHLPKVPLYICASNHLQTFPASTGESVFIRFRGPADQPYGLLDCSDLSKSWQKDFCAFTVNCAVKHV